MAWRSEMSRILRDQAIARFALHNEGHSLQGIQMLDSCYFFFRDTIFIIYIEMSTFAVKAICVHQPLGHREDQECSNKASEEPKFRESSRKRSNTSANNCAGIEVVQKLGSIGVGVVMVDEVTDELVTQSNGATHQHIRSYYIFD
jgi:hypothetical protein